MGNTESKGGGIGGRQTEDLLKLAFEVTQDLFAKLPLDRLKNEIEPEIADQFTKFLLDLLNEIEPLLGIKNDILHRSVAEKLSVKARKRKVKTSIMNLGLNVTEYFDPPVIAVLGSGGGLRAMVAFLGTLSKLAELNLLNLVTYMAGTSGSTWCMSSLYCYETWSNNSCLKFMEQNILKTLTSEFPWKTSMERMKAAFMKEKHSLTDIWAYVVVYFMTKELNEEKLSSHKERCESGNNPYPIYSAVEKKTGTWFEFTPHACGFPKHKSFVKTEHLGSKFEEGNLSERHPEPELCYLRGLWGSAPANDDIISGLFKGLKGSFSTMSGFNTEGIFSKLTPAVKETDQDIGEVEDKELSEEEFYCACRGSGGATNLCSKVTTENTEEGKTAAQDTWQDLYVFYRIMKCLGKWEWGTLNNFLYKCKDDVCPELVNEEEISLVDSGLYINTPYPLMLPPHRKVDLILSFDFSAGDPFETLKKTAEYCKENHISFPNVDTKETSEDIPSQCCYIFEGDGKRTPDVMHFPLFNNQTCEGKVKEMEQKYSTFKHAYEESEVKELLEVSKKNVQESYEKIDMKIKQWVELRNQRGRP
ncbi:cytosolic phospholipase A2 gamma-like [Hyperolius riggenbachi]|uniref:cytosolic phospholipase A2 gamma-like n=1 Tax=Hyperolius riggenbachi TaxID=752182 RepID=UPI0035A26D57